MSFVNLISIMYLWCHVNTQLNNELMKIMYVYNLALLKLCIASLFIRWLARNHSASIRQSIIKSNEEKGLIDRNGEWSI